MRDDTKDLTCLQALKPINEHIGIVCARFHRTLTDALKQQALETLQQSGIVEEHIHIDDVPGAVELPLMAQHQIHTHNVKGVLVLGVVIKGETPHFDYVCQMCAQGTMQVQLEHGIPVTFGLITANTYRQAEERCLMFKKGQECTITLLKMMKNLRH